MSASNYRIKDYKTVHHITSRTAHRVFFLSDDERNDLLKMVRRAAKFCGIKLWSWCIMTNHFHLLVYLPAPKKLSEDDIMRRYASLKGKDARKRMEAQLATWRQEGEVGLKRVDDWLNRQRARMYDVGEFMKIVKQWFTEEYNRRHSHVGTLWESTYHDRIVEYRERAILQCAGCIHLNPIRGAICAGYCDYPWSSMTALARDDSLALKGFRQMYVAPAATAEELIARHTPLLDALLEVEKRRRAVEIARKRMAGYEVPCDPLTSEALVAQATAHREMVLKSGVDIGEESLRYKLCTERRNNIESEMLELIKANPRITSAKLVRACHMPTSTGYKYLTGMQRRGIISKASRSAPWKIAPFYV